MAAAGRGGRALEVNEDWVTTDVTFRPLIGFRKFQQERPFYVKPVCQATCVCVKHVTACDYCSMHS